MRDRKPLFFANKHCISLGLSVTLSFASVLQANAQLIPDNTLGKENSIVNSSKLLQRIDGGAIRDSNLFHSFKEFNIDSGKSVYFSNPTAIQNILTRVTGKNSSQIFGKLGVLGNANLFLLNPNGIVFGQGASLDISGSFSATTSTSILFDNGFEFSANNPNNIPLLKVNIIPGLQYSRFQQGDIINQGNLTVGKNLNLIAKNINLTGQLNSGRDSNLQASDTLQVRDNSTNPFIASAGGDLLLQANNTINIFALNHSDSGLFSGNDLILQSSKPVEGDARYFSGGNFRIEKLDGNLGDLSSPNDPIIRASGDVSFDSYTGASLHILAGGSVNITGDVTITGADGTNGLEQTVTLSDGESLEIDGKNQATLDIRAGTTEFGTPGVTGSGSFVPGNPNTGGSGSSSDIVIGGNIRVDAADGLVFLTNLYNPNDSLSGGKIQLNGSIDTSSNSGNGGDINIIAKNSIEIINSDSNSTSFLHTTSSNGQAGDVIMKAGLPNDSAVSTIRLVDTNIDTADFGSNGKSGSITLESKDGGNIELLGDSLKPTIFTDTFANNQQAIGNQTGGDIQIKGGNITINNYELNANVNEDAQGNGGNIRVEADNLAIINSNLLATSQGLGDAGNIQINTEQLILEDNAKISSSSKISEAGKITINAFDKVNIATNSTIESTAIDGGIAGFIDINTKEFNIGDNSKLTVNGNIGYILIEAEDININNQATISSNTFDGEAGFVRIQAQDSVQIEADSTIESTAIDGGIAGFIDINTKEFNIRDNSKLTVNGNIGYILIEAEDINLNNQATISSNTFDGEAGFVRIQAQDSVQIEADSTIESTAIDGGIAGFIDINTKEFNIRDNSKLTVNGNIGYILIEAEDINLNNQATISSNTFDGEAGFVRIQAQDSVQIEADSTIESTAIDGGIAGFIDINTKEFNIRDNSKLTVNGNIGYILIEAEDIKLNNQAKISGNTFDGEAGFVRIRAQDSVQIEADSTIESTAIDGGIAGFIDINTKEFNIRDNSKLTVSSPSGQAGNLDITADNLLLNQSILAADTGISENSEGANITLDINNLFMMFDNSSISAQAYNFANGGNITINNPQGFVIGLPFENSDITANADKGNGGNIDITTQNIFGLVFREQKTPKSDITASSKFGLNGEVTVNQLSVNPATDLVELPKTLVETNGIKAGCAASNGNNFVVSGKGGLPQSPDDLFNGKTTATELFDLVPTEQILSNIIDGNNQVNHIIIDNPTKKINQILEATGFVVDDEGNVMLVAQIPQDNLQNSLLPSVDCESFSAVIK